MKAEGHRVGRSREWASPGSARNGYCATSQLGVNLQPLVDRLAELLLQGQVLHAEETPVQQLDPGKGQTKRAYMWA